ncbi:MAG: lipid II flippase MurJ [Terracidiphilus sp.]
MPAQSRWARALRLLRPSHAHSTYTATILLMSATFLSRIIGLVRVKYIAWQFGAGPQTDAYVAAFRLPDLMNYFLVGGAASITFVTILNRYRERGEEAEGERVLSIVINFISLVLSAGVIAAMFLAAPYIRATNPGFAPWQVELSAHMTRILLPGQIFFFVGGVLGATLMVRRQFFVLGLTGIAYNFGIIMAGVLLGRRMGIPALAVGALAGAFLGPFAMNAVAAARAGVRYRWGIDFSHPGLIDWVKMTLPLMAGFTLPFLDDYIVGYYASHGAGDITRLINAKQLFGAPMAMLAQAAGAASLPFFARIWAQEKRYEFATGVADSVSRIVALGLLAASGMIAMSAPLVQVIFLGGHFNMEDVHRTAIFFAIYTLALSFWAAQAIYSRAFYAAGITWLPMLAGSVIALLAMPIYALGYHWHGAVGLALASDAGIALQAVTLAVLLHQRRMVSLASLDFVEMGRCLVAGVVSGGVVWVAIWGLGKLPSHFLQPQGALAIRMTDLALLAAGSVVWVVIAKWVLEKTGSALPEVAMKRLGLA